MAPGTLVRAQIDRQAAGTSAAQLGWAWGRKGTAWPRLENDWIQPDGAYMYMERPGKVGIGPEAQSFGRSGRDQQVILWSSETKVMALEEKPNPSGMPA